MRIVVLVVLLASQVIAKAQYGDRLPPDKIYGTLFTDVQMHRIFKDGKTFVDCVPKKDPKEIVANYLQLKNNPAVRYSFKNFVLANFYEPVNPADTYQSNRSEPITTHIKNLWNVLKRVPDTVVNGSSLLPLPSPYIVPGGRFREIYYWDSYFTMLGLQASDDYEMIENMIKNFAYMIQQYGHIPNGNRSYFLSRSQPPFFSLMLDLLAEKKGSMVYAEYQLALQREYDYWMDKTAATKHVVKMPDGSVLNRYYDQDVVPRQESFYEDSILAAGYTGNKAELYRNLRSCAESGWDFSSRWLTNDTTLSTIQVTSLLPVDLNSLLYHLELTLSRAYKETGNLLQANYYRKIAARRKAAVNKYCWSAADGWYYDYNIKSKKQSKEMTIAGMAPFFLQLAPDAYAAPAAKVVEARFVKPGGVTATLKSTGQQWDAPNGWAPLQWIAIQGLENYNQKTLAKEIATRWAQLNIKVYKNTGKLMEKYNVVDTHLEAGGGEYPSQDGFGWTNGVLLKLMQLYGIGE